MNVLKINIFILEVSLIYISNLYMTLKDKKKFGKGKKPKSRSCKSFGYCKGKEERKFERKIKKAVKHKCLFHIQMTDLEESYFIEMIKYKKLYCIPLTKDEQ